MSLCLLAILIASPALAEGGAAEHQRAHPERHGARKAPIEMQHAPQRRLERAAGAVEIEPWHHASEANQARLVKSRALLFRILLIFSVDPLPGAPVKRFADLS